MKLPVITLWSPWAEWVALEWKTIETRTHSRFASLVGKRIGIHMGIMWDRTAMEAAGPFLKDWQWAVTRIVETHGIPRQSAIIATAFVKEHRELNPLDNQAALIDCTHVTRYGLVLTDVKKIDPTIVTPGKQGIWYYNFPDEVLNAG